MNGDLKPKSFPPETSAKHGSSSDEDLISQALLKAADVPPALPPGILSIEDKYRVDYEVVAFKTLSVLWRRKWLITAICTAAIVLAGVAHRLIGPRYEAIAVIQLDLGSQDAPGNAVQRTSIDGAKIVKSQAGLIQARAIARGVVVRLGLDEIQTESKMQAFIAKTESKIQAFIAKIIGYGLFYNAPRPSRVDLATERLLSNLMVENDRQSYLIKVKYSASNPREAARIANAVVGEYLHIRHMQKLTDSRTSVDRELRKLKSTLGDKHPVVVGIEAELALAQAELEAAGQGAVPTSAREITESGYVVPADEVTIPSGPKLRTILGVALFGGLISGIFLALLLERRAMRELLSGSLVRR